MALTPGSKILISDLNLMPRSFASTAARDAYYTANPSLKVAGIVAVIGSGSSYTEYTWNGSGWVLTGGLAAQQRGNATIPSQSLVSGGYGILAVTFPAAFPSAPVVVATLSTGAGGTDYLVPRVFGVTATGFSIAVVNVWSGTVAIPATPLGWHAVV